MVKFLAISLKFYVCWQNIEQLHNDSDNRAGKSLSPTRPVLRRIDSNTTSLTPDNARKRRSRELFNHRKYDINKPKHSVAATVSNLTSHLVSSENQRLTPSTVSSESHKNSHHVSLPSTSSLSHNLTQNIHPATTCIPLSDHNSTSLEQASSVGQTTSAEETADSRGHPNIEFCEFKESQRDRT